MSDDQRRIKVTMRNEHGRHEFNYSPAQINDLISLLVNYALSMDVVVPLTGDSALGQPIHADRMGMNPAPDSATDMILVIGAKSLEFQFRLPVADAFAMLERLKEESEPDPNSPRHH